MLLWSAWDEREDETLAEVITRFTSIHPDVRIKQQHFASVDEMIAQFRIAAQSGLGPDLLLAPNQWLKPLADEHLISTIDIDSVVLDRYLPDALEALQYNDQLYGLPESLSTMVLYYDRTRVESTATTLDGLLKAAANGHTIAFSAGFQDAFWGIQAFGGKLFDENGKAILDHGGFANWLAWLKDARDLPGVLFDTNRDALRNRFITDDVDYYIGSSDELNTILDAVGEERLGVTTLPSGPLGSAGPLLNVEGIYFSSVSSSNQRKLALELALFTTNAEQQSLLMRKALHAPANNNVRINPRLYPIIASIVAQARTAIPLVNTRQMASVMTLGADGYTKVLEGVIDPVTAAAEVTAQVNEASGLNVTAVAEPSCRGIGTIMLGHSLPLEGIQTLNEVVRRFRSVCPAIIIKLEEMPADVLLNSLLSNGSTSDGIDLAIGPQDWIANLASKGVVTNITVQTDATMLQRFRPISIEAMRYQGSLYGLPLWLNVDALYFNRQLVTDPARTLSELSSQASSGMPIGLDTRFEQAFWGLGAFGSQFVNHEGSIILAQSGFIDWLAWLKTQQSSAGIQLSNDASLLKKNFLSGQSAYFIADLGALAELQSNLGAENLGVATLPTGPVGDASPLVSLQGIFFNSQSPATQATLALEFAHFATNVESQRLWMSNLHRVPVNTQVEFTNEPIIATFAEQIKTARLLPNLANTNDMITSGNQVYVDVLEKNIEPAAAAARMGE